MVKKKYTYTLSTNILFTLKMCSSDLSHFLIEDNVSFNLYIVK